MHYLMVALVVIVGIRFKLRLRRGDILPKREVRDKWKSETHVNNNFAGGSCYITCAAVLFSCPLWQLPLIVPQCKLRLHWSPLIKELGIYHSAVTFVNTHCFQRFQRLVWTNRQKGWGKQRLFWDVSTNSFFRTCCLTLIYGGFKVLFLFFFGHERILGFGCCSPLSRKLTSLLLYMEMELMERSYSHSLVVFIE